YFASGSTRYSLKAGADAALFSFVAATGAVTLTGNPDYETKGSYSFTVVATDAAGNASEQVVTLGINNLDEVAPTITSGTTASAINENSGAGQVVYTVTSTDSGDIATGSTSYSLKVGADAALFRNKAATGAVTLIRNPDYETKGSYSYTVVAT
ncbi:cadherin repeat domain-containing protein, partial [Aeromonas caviae]|uniref:cadherin repeat domain-containing protein n=1 Tax=Aeromonas caviae TaxID=648 RepID=UPI0029DE1E11